MQDKRNSHKNNFLHTTIWTTDEENGNDKHNDVIMLRVYLWHWSGWLDQSIYKNAIFDLDVNNMKTSNAAAAYIVRPHFWYRT